MRKIARKYVQTEDKEDFRAVVDAEKVRELLGTIKFRKQDIARKSEIGLVNGLAWTEVGGDVLQVEATLVKGKGEVTLTGKLGEVMQESARAALTCVRTRAEKFGIEQEKFREMDLHIHVPEGAIPKDGPSAGITLATAMVSVFNRHTRPPRCRNDRRNNSARKSSAHRRLKRKTSRGASFRIKNRHRVKRQRKGFSRYSRRNPRRFDDSHG